MNKYISEMIGTMILVLTGCGSIVFAGNMPSTVSTGVGALEVAMAVGLSVVALAYVFGGISGCHINPAITLGVYCSGRMGGKDALLYMISQVIGGDSRVSRTFHIGFHWFTCRFHYGSKQRLRRGRDVTGLYRRDSIHVYFCSRGAGSHG